GKGIWQCIPSRIKPACGRQVRDRLTPFDKDLVSFWKLKSKGNCGGMIYNCISSPAPIGIGEEAGQQETRKLVSVKTLTPAVEMTLKGSNFSIAPGKEARSFDMLWNRATRGKKRQKDPAMA
ncbi:MAG TPA: hypothetical protein VLA71_00490, partial [Algoriphagus sp.]|nr:hypothetical protein [Algoriphagus sp.]